MSECTLRRARVTPATDSPRRPNGFVRSPFRYPGGKFYALQHILPFIMAAPHDEYREPFVGGGTVFFAKPKVQYSWLNDLESDLMITYRVMADPASRQALVGLVSSEVATKQRHEEMRKFQPGSPLEIAFRTYYLNRTSYSGIIHKPAWGFAEGKSSPPGNWGEFIEGAGVKLEGTKLTADDFEKVVSAPPIGSRVLLYLDPPYFHADQKRAYTRHFRESDHDRLADLLRVTDFQFCLSYDDCPEIRSRYSWARIFERSWLYNTANVSGLERIVGNELIITNYEPSEVAQLRLWD